MDALKASSTIAVSGMKAQATRLRTISQNMANADNTATKPGGIPYRRQAVTFINVFDPKIGADVVKVGSVVKDMSQMQREYDPNSPAADDQGYVLKPNVQIPIELMDMKEAERSYEANLNAYSTAKDMNSRTLEMLK